MSPSLFVLIPALACAIFALIFASGARRGLHRRAALGAGLRMLLAMGFGLAALALVGLGLSIRHYLALEGEVTVAELEFSEIVPQRFEARRARDLGFVAETSFDDIIQEYIGAEGRGLTG